MEYDLLYQAGGLHLYLNDRKIRSRCQRWGLPNAPNEFSYTRLYYVVINIFIFENVHGSFNVSSVEITQQYGYVFCEYLFCSV